MSGNPHAVPQALPEAPGAPQALPRRSQAPGHALPVPRRSQALPGAPRACPARPLIPGHAPGTRHKGLGGPPRASQVLGPRSGDSVAATALLRAPAEPPESDIRGQRPQSGRMVTERDTGRKGQACGRPIPRPFHLGIPQAFPAAFRQACQGPAASTDRSKCVRAIPYFPVGNGLDDPAGIV